MFTDEEWKEVVSALNMISDRCDHNECYNCPFRLFSHDPKEDRPRNWCAFTDKYGEGTYPFEWCFPKEKRNAE